MLFRNVATYRETIKTNKGTINIKFKTVRVGRRIGM